MTGIGALFVLLGLLYLLMVQQQRAIRTLRDETEANMKEIRRLIEEMDRDK